jgi:hypothetical protein
MAGAPCAPLANSRMRRARRAVIPLFAPALKPLMTATTIGGATSCAVATLPRSAPQTADRSAKEVMERWSMGVVPRNVPRIVYDRASDARANRMGCGFRTRGILQHGGVGA